MKNNPKKAPMWDAVLNIYKMWSKKRDSLKDFNNGIALLTEVHQ